jgi:RNA polymerase sigma factor (sigma-70 family)
MSNADDVLQEACLRVLELKEPQAIREPDRYIGRIAKNLFVDGLRKQKRAKALFVDTSNAVEVPDDQPSAERVLAGKELLGRVMAEIDRLPVRCREAFILHRFENLTYPAIARNMSVSISTVEKHIAEAMARLARALDLETQ